jgi:hypothetical protein
VTAQNPFTSTLPLLSKRWMAPRGMHNTCPGKEFWARVWVSFIEVDCARCVLSFAQDISASKAAEQKIKDLAFYDPLTGLANRRLLSERLSQSVLMGGRMW